jgi:hypothetical protein
VAISDTDSPGAGTYTYSMKISGAAGGGSYWNADVTVNNVKK